MQKNFHYLCTKFLEIFSQAFHFHVSVSLMAYWWFRPCPFSLSNEHGVEYWDADIRRFN